MAVRYHILFECKNGEVVITRQFNENTEKSSISLEEISQIQEMCQHFNWSQSERLSRQIGETLFTLLNGNNVLVQALKEADLHGEPLQLYIEKEDTEKDFIPDLPFELLYDSGFIVPSKIHIIRHVSDYGSKKKVNPQNRPLKVLFMACSPEGVTPVLDYEKEEEIILEVTKELPVEIDVEDTGSLQGLADCLENNEYDVIHLSGHANIEEGIPIFCMEDEEGSLEKVTPSQLQDILNESLKRPRLVFLSGCRTGETPGAAVSFARYLVAEHSPTVVGWGLPVSDPGATIAATKLYRELSRGKSIVDAVFSARQVLYKNNFPDWSLLRLFSDGTPLDIPLVEKGQKRKLKARDIQYAYLQNSQVKVLEKGFIGRRRQIQRGIRILKKDKQKVGLLLHGTGGLGKSCLAGKFCERFKDYALVIVHGNLSEFTFSEAAKDAFIRTGDKEGQEVLQEQLEMPDKIRKLCSTSFQKEKYLILLDDFEKNLEGYEQGTPVVAVDAVAVLEMLLHYLPLTCKMTQLIITSRYTFPLSVNGRDLVKENLEGIGLTSFLGADEQKKVSELGNINGYPDLKVRQKLIEAGCGNPKLMEALNSLLEVEKDVDIEDLLEKVKGKQEEFVQELILKKILKSQSQDFQKVMQYVSVYGLPVSKKGIEIVCEGIKKWASSVDSGVQLSLIEKGKDKVSYYWVTPLLREAIFGELSEDEQMRCHEGAVKYYQAIVSADGYQPVYAFELIDHALLCKMDEAAIGGGGRLLSYLRNVLLYKEALFEGEHILSHITKLKRNEESSFFLNEFGAIFYDLGDFQKAITCLEQALEIDKEIYGEKHPHVATMLNNLGGAWDSLGDSKKAIDHYEQALKIIREVYGEKHPHVATTLNNLGMVSYSLGDLKKAITCLEQALEIDKETYGEKHPHVATDLNNLGMAWNSLGDLKKAIDHYEQAFSIIREVYGEKHPHVAKTFNNLGMAWNSLGDSKKAIDYFEQALEIDKETYGEKHPDVATMLNNLGLAWNSLGDSKKAIEYYEQALEIDKEIYGEKHPSVATDLNNLGGVWNSLGDSKKAIEYYEQALSIIREVYGEKHPSVATTLNNLGMVSYSLGDSKKAIEYYEQALEIDKEIYGEKHPSVATRLNNLGMVSYSLGDSKKAIDYFEQAFSIIREVYGEKHPHVATTFNNLGLAWNSLGDPKKAIEYFEQALEIDKEIYGEKHPSVATDLNNLGGAWDSLGDPKKAIDHYEQAVEITKEIGNRAGESRSYANLGAAYCNLEDFKKAIEYYDRALAVAREIGDTEFLSHISFKLGLLLVDQGRWYDGLHLLEENLSIRRQEDDPRTHADTIYQVARTHHIMGNLEKARIHYRDALRLYEYINNPRGIAACKVGLGRLMLQIGLIDEALYELTASHQIYLELGDEQRSNETKEVIQLANQIKEGG